MARSLPQKIGIPMSGTELKVRASPDGKLSDLFCWKTLATGPNLPAILREPTVTLPKSFKPIERASVMHHRVVTCHVVEKLSTSSLWPTGPTSFEGKEWKFAGKFHDDHGGQSLRG